MRWLQIRLQIVRSAQQDKVLRSTLRAMAVEGSVMSRDMVGPASAACASSSGISKLVVR